MVASLRDDACGDERSEESTRGVGVVVERGLVLRFFDRLDGRNQSTCTLRLLLRRLRLLRRRRQLGRKVVSLNVVMNQVTVVRRVKGRQYSRSV